MYVANVIIIDLEQILKLDVEVFYDSLESNGLTHNNHFASLLFLVLVVATMDWFLLLRKMALLSKRNAKLDINRQSIELLAQ
mgnify:FL=1